MQIKSNWFDNHIKLARKKQAVTVQQVANARRYAEYVARLTRRKEPLLQLWSGE